MDGIAGLLPLIVIVLLFYFAIMRPQRNRQRKLASLQQELTPGREVMTSAGLYATVRAVEGDVVVLETSPGVTTRWARASIVKVVTQLDDIDRTSADGATNTGVEISKPILKKHASHAPDAASSHREPPAGTTSG